MNNIEDTIVAYLNGQASTEEVRQLFQWVRDESENAREFARFSLIHAQLREQLSGEQQARQSTELATPGGGNWAASVNVEIEPAGSLEHNEPTKKQLGPQLKPQWNRLLIKTLIGSLAASLLIGIGLAFYWWDGNDGSGNRTTGLTLDSMKRFASVAKVVDAEWELRDFQTGDRTSAQSFDLKAGFVRLQLDNGVNVTLQGPAKFELVSLSMAKLTSGLLTVTVPPGSEGFQVDTPLVEVVDLGTAFGIQLDPDGASMVTVFDGEVDVSNRESDESLRLKEGETVHVKSGIDIEKIEFDAKRYDQVWPVSSGVAGSTGAFRFVPPWPRRLRFVRSNDEVFIVPEGFATTLAQSLKVNTSQPGEYRRTENLVVSEIPAGQRVRSFILHFHPQDDNDRPRFKRTIGSITFDRPVLGLIVLHEELAASATRFSGRKAGEFLEHRQLELTGTSVGDVITLSEDRHTVSIGLVAPGRFSDVVRVIVDAGMQAIEQE
jgi:ferric-dicitrate binding protein FerR (iron transport regulator)